MCDTSKPTRKLTSAGRPSLYTPSLGLKLITAMATGLSLEAAAAKIGVGARTLFSWQNQHEEFRQAIQEGRQRALLFWEEQAISMAKGAAGNAQLVMLALKNRSRAASGWHDAQRLKHTGTDGGPVQVQPVVGPVAVLCRSSEHILCSKRDEP